MVKNLPNFFGSFRMRWNARKSLQEYPVTRQAKKRALRLTRQPLASSVLNAFSRLRRESLRARSASKSIDSINALSIKKRRSRIAGRSPRRQAHASAVSDLTRSETARAVVPAGCVANRTIPRFIDSRLHQLYLPAVLTSNQPTVHLNGVTSGAPLHHLRVHRPVVRDKTRGHSLQRQTEEVKSIHCNLRANVTTLKPIFSTVTVRRHSSGQQVREVSGCSESSSMVDRMHPT